MTNKFSELLKLKEEYERKIKEVGSEGFKEFISEFFVRNPKVDGIFWTQYTPYFNDGDVCVFSVYEPGIISKQLTEEHDVESGWDIEFKISSFYKYDGSEAKEIPELESIFDDLNNTWEHVPVDILQALFGDHALVIFMRDGTHKVQEYEHD